MNNAKQLIDQILQPLLDLDPSLKIGLRGCSLEDIQAIESQSDSRLPCTFVALLERIGRCRGQLMPGADFGFPEILGFRQIAESLLQEQYCNLELDPYDVVFEMEQGYQFFFFRAFAGEDPPVYFYNDDDPEFVLVKDTFSEWVKTWVEEEIYLRSSSRISS